MIKRIRIQNYRSLVDVDVELDPLTVLIGRSGTGKSNFVRAIRALRDALASRSLNPFRDCEPFGQPNSLVEFRIEMNYIDNPGTYIYGCKINPRLAGSHPNQHYLDFESLYFNDRCVFSQDRGNWVSAPTVHPLPTPNKFALANINGISEVGIAYHLLTRGIGCYDFQGSVLQLQDHSLPTIPTGLGDSGGNFIQTTSLLRDDLKLSGDWKSLTRSLSALNPSVQSADLHQPERNKIEIAYKSRGKTIVMDSATESEGFRRYFATLLALYQAPGKPLCMFEHPENGIHPGALEMLAGEFRRHVERNRGQVILTTHNPHFLDYFEPEEIRVVDIENQSTKIGPLAPEQMEALKLNLMTPGELLTVDPARLEGQLAQVPA